MKSERGVIALTSDLLLWIGESRNPIKINRVNDWVMDSVINYYNLESPKPLYNAGKLFLDSGAFTARQRGLFLDRGKVVAIQEEIMPDRAVPLDYPFIPGMSVQVMVKFWEKTRENILFWQNCTSLKNKIVPVLHAWSKRSMILNLKWLQREADTDMIMLGSLVGPDFTKFSGFFGDRQPRKELIDMISFGIEAAKRYTDFKVHITGLGSSPLMLHLAYYLGADSTDSAGYRRKAAYGKIVLPGTGERHVSDREVKFGKKKLDDGLELAWLSRCGCPICKQEPRLLLEDWRARAIHNEYVLKQEWKRAMELLNIGEDAYEEYLESIYKRSGFANLWEYTKLRKRYARISEVLFGGRI